MILEHKTYQRMCKLYQGFVEYANRRLRVTGASLDLCYADDRDNVFEVTRAVFANDAPST